MKVTDLSTTELVIRSQDGPVLTILLNRPEKLNALNPEMLGALSEIIDDVARDRSIGTVILTGTGRAFCVGADLDAFVTLSPLDTWDEWVRGGHVLMDRIAALRVPVIGALNGMTFGGGLELALACDFCIATEDASFASPEVKIGTVCGWGGSQRLPKLIGAGRAKQMLYSGARIDSATAERWGLVTEVVPEAALLPRAREIAEEITANAPVSVEVTKQLANGADMVGLGAAMESLAGAMCRATADGDEGIASFKEKRPPEYTRT